MTTNRAGIYAWEEAVESVCGAHVDFSTLHTAGKTDVEIAEQLARRYGGNSVTVTARRLVSEYEARLPAALHRKQGRVLPGVEKLLSICNRRSDIVCGLLTGNTSSGAHAKLTHYGIDQYLSFGSFSGKRKTRNEIARFAYKIAKLRTRRHISPADVFVIGDTPLDILCGKAIGAKTIALATGQYSAAELRKYFPYRTFASLPDPAVFFAAINAWSRKTGGRP